MIVFSDLLLVGGQVGGVFDVPASAHPPLLNQDPDLKLEVVVAIVE